MRCRISDYVALTALFGTIYFAPIPAYSMNDDMYVCATVSEILETESEDCMYFLAKGDFFAEGIQEKQLRICIDDGNDANRDSTLAVESFEQQTEVFIVYNEGNVRKMQAKCP